jgi:drug/metabolite transporter (DMT)-like permease
MTESASKWRAMVLVVSLSVIWGLAFVGIRRADFELTATNLTLIRWIISSAGFLALWPFVGKPKTRFERNDLPRLVFVALFNVAVYHLALNYGEDTVSSSLAGLLISLGPVFVVFFSAVTLRERVGGKLIIALALAVVGAGVLSFGSGGFSSQNLVGPLAVVLAALAYGAYSVASKPLVTKYGPFPVVIWVSFLGTAFLSPLLTQGFFSQVSSLSLEGWYAVLFLAILSTVVANSIFYTLVSGRTVSRLSVQLYIVPLVSVVGGVLLLQEAVTVYTFIGGAIMLVAVTLATAKS